jgi:DNA polymerase III subunit delta
MAKSVSAPQNESSLLGAARECPSPVYLLVGEPFQTESVAHALIDVLVPPQHRSFNLEMYHGRTTPIASILDSMRMRGLFPGTKVIWVREPTLFLSAEKRVDISGALFAAWAEERHADAAERLLTLAAMAGWTPNRFVEDDWASVSETDLKDLLGRAADADERQVLGAVRAYCTDRRLTVSDYRDDSGLLEDFVKAGVPAGAVLIFTAAAVDHRKRIFKTIAETGTVLELTLERERSGALSDQSIDRVIDGALRRSGKRLAPAARKLIHQRSGPEAAALSIEVEKLCLYVGDAEDISESDVRESFRDLAESWIFDFTKAFSQRDAGTAVRLLRGLFAQGEHPLRLLALIARELRILLLVGDCLTGALAGKWHQRVSFATFRDRLWPEVGEEEQKAFAGVHPYVVYLALQNASRTDTSDLQRGLLQLQQLDIKLKSSAGDPRILFEAFVLDLCRSAKNTEARI